MRASLAVVALVLAALALPAAAQVFKWVDEQGRTHYGEKPPEGVKATPLGTAPPPPSGSEAKPAPPDWKQKELEFQRRKIEREKSEGKDAARRRERDARLAADCADARESLTILQEQIPVYDRDKQGQRVYIEDAERSQRIAKRQKFLAENCR